MSVVPSCHKCGAEVQTPPGARIGRRDSCSRCGADLHCCLNCRFYDPGKHQQCAEPQAEYVQYKDQGNFCEYFDPGAGRRARSAAGDDPRKKFESLFKI
jgi:hypothetical protein